MVVIQKVRVWFCWSFVIEYRFHRQKEIIERYGMCPLMKLQLSIDYSY